MKKYKVGGMTCGACSKMLELDLEEAGITAKCDYATRTLKVGGSNGEKNNKLKDIIKNSGYSISEISD